MCIHRVLKQVHPDVSCSQKIMSILSLFVNDIFATYFCSFLLPPALLLLPACYTRRREWTFEIPSILTVVNVEQSVSHRKQPSWLHVQAQAYHLVS